MGAFHSKLSKACAKPKSCDLGSSCDHEPSCGCSQAQAPEPTCGCEAAPTCGCESPSCRCSSHGGSSRQPVYQSGPVYPSPRQPIAPYNAPTPMPSQQHIEQPYVPAPVPAPSRLPDAAVDPFQDDAVRNAPRRIQARPINYSRPSSSPAASRPSIRPPAGTYGVQFNDQAMFRYRVSDPASGLAVAPASRAVVPAQAQSRQVFRASSVQPGQEPARLQSGPAVGHLRSDGVRPATGAGQGSAGPVRPASAQQPRRNSYYNPLRS